MPTQRKISIVNELTEKLAKAKALVFTDYQGLKHKQLEELRKKLKKVEAEFIVTKNTLLSQAAKQSPIQIPKEGLSHATATLFAYADEILPVKELGGFLKTAGFGKIKSGFLGRTFLNFEEVEKLSKLPPKNMLHAQLAAQLNSPLYGLHHALSWNIRKLGWTLEAVRTKKS